MHMMLCDAMRCDATVAMSLSKHRPCQMSSITLLHSVLSHFISASREDGVGGVVDMSKSMSKFAGTSKLVSYTKSSCTY